MQRSSFKTTKNISEHDVETGISNAACTGIITNSHQLDTAEIGLTIARDQNILANPLYPSYCLMVRLLELSIEDYLKSEREAEREAEIHFWRESRLFLFYGHLVCELERCLHGRQFTISDLRRGAEVRMGLQRGYLSSGEPLTEGEEQTLICKVQAQFAYIRKTIGHVPDEQADRRFLKRRRDKAKNPPAKQCDLPMLAAG